MYFQQRIEKLQQLLKLNNVDAFLVDDPINLYYLTGLKLSSGKVLLTPEHARLIVDGRYEEAAKKNLTMPVVLLTPTVFKELFQQNPFNHCETLGFNAEKTSYQSYQELQKTVQEILNESKPNRKLKLFPVGNLLRELRAIKDPEEIKLLRQAADLNCLGFDFLCTLLQEGTSEYEMAIELDIFWRRQGALGLSFDPIIAFGTNTSMPHHNSGDTVLSKENPVLMDIGVNVKRYQSDMTRVVFFGFADPTILKIYSAVQEAQQAALDACKPGALLCDLDAIARKVLAKAGFEQYFTHGLGHGVGLEIHEAPSLRKDSPDWQKPLEPGMVITIEPGVYLPKVGGVRIEDTIIITNNGYDNLIKRSKNPIFK